ncbi:MAG TPA: hypothetical protein VGG04_18185 [Candidatus Sulfotelmatobacter sp.]|jgi:hypothetical protein
MLRSQGPIKNLKIVAAGIAMLCLFGLHASAQDFSLTAQPFNPVALAPGGTTYSNIAMVANSGFVGPVTFGCTVTPPVQIPPEDLPVCQVSPPSLAGSGGATATITTTGSTSQIGYTVTITGTDGSGTVSSSPLPVTVLSVAPQYTITVQTAIAPSSVPAGNGAQGVIRVNPLDGYMTPSNGYITLYCASISPLVTIAPVCSFTYPNGDPGVEIGGNTPVTANLTISTFGPVITGSSARPRAFYAIWLSFPLLGLVAIGAAIGGKRSRQAWGLLALFALSGSLLLVPACGNTNTNNATTTPNGVTPANSYTFTIVGVDTNGVVSSNTGSTTSAGPTVTLAVTAPSTP